MQRGKSLAWLLLFLLVTGIIDPVWQWFVGQILDKILEDPNKALSGIGGVLGMLEPYQHFLLGAAFGIFVSLVVGYWERIILWLRRGRIWVHIVCQLAWRSLAGKRPLSKGMTKFAAGEGHKTISISSPVDWWNSEVRWWPEDKFHCRLIGPETLSVTRHDKNSRKKWESVSYEIIGRPPFKATLRKWRETDFVGLHLAHDREMKESVKGEPRSRQSPPDTSRKIQR